jgi:hypothetical protein
LRCGFQLTAVDLCGLSSIHSIEKEEKNCISICGLVCSTEGLGRL